MIYYFHFQYPIYHKRISDAKMSLLTKLIRSFPNVPHSFIPLYPVIFVCIVYSVNFVNFVCQSVHAVVSTRFDTFHINALIVYDLFRKHPQTIYVSKKRKKRTRFIELSVFLLFFF